MPLKDVVSQGFVLARALQSYMARNDPRKRPPGEISLSGEQIFAEVLRQEAGECVKQPVQHRDPGGEKVEIPAPAILVLQYEWERQINKGRSSHVTGFAPIKAWVRQENGDSTDQQAKEANRGDPVGDADDRRVPRSIRNI